MRTRGEVFSHPAAPPQSIMAIPLNDPTKTNAPGSARARSLAGRAEGRKQYRVHKQGSAQLEATILGEGNLRAVGECSDLSVGGVGVTIPQTKDLSIVEGAHVRVRVQYLGRPKSIEAAAEVVTISHVGTTLRYGLRFESVSEVVGQIDAFYARWFNRRRSERVMPDFATKMTATVRWNDGEFEARVHDLSMGGIGILATTDQVVGLSPKGRIELSVTLPGASLPIVCRAKIANLKTFTKNVLLGVSFEPNGGIERHASALQRFIDDRQRSIAAYNEAISQQPKRAG